MHCSVVDGKQKHSLVCTSTHKTETQAESEGGYNSIQFNALTL